MSGAKPAGHISEFGPNHYTYGTLKCRCDGCVTFVREAARASRARRAEAGTPKAAEPAPTKVFERKASPRERVEQAIAAGDSTSAIMRRLGVDYETVKGARDRLGVTDSGITNDARRRPCPGCGVLPRIEWRDQESTVRYTHLSTCVRTPHVRRPGLDHEAVKAARDRPGAGE